jgi:hypothetical protein
MRNFQHCDKKSPKNLYEINYFHNHKHTGTGESG